jgi:hypothetical protein
MDNKKGKLMAINVFLNDIKNISNSILDAKLKNLNLSYDLKNENQEKEIKKIIKENKKQDNFKNHFKQKIRKYFEKN